MPLTQGAHTVYNDSIFKIVDNMAEWQPTVMQCVPRVFESIHERVSDGIAKLPRAPQNADRLGAGSRRARRPHGATRAGRSARSCWACYLIADKLVLSKIRARFGGKREVLGQRRRAAQPADRATSSSPSASRSWKAGA